MKTTSPFGLGRVPLPCNAAESECFRWLPRTNAALGSHAKTWELFAAGSVQGSRPSGVADPVEILIDF
jgi:hypothetical protein